MVDVSLEALQKIKQSLTTFQQNTSHIGDRADNICSSVISDCSREIKVATSDISESESEISRLQKLIATKKNDIYIKTGELEKVKRDIIDAEKRIAELSMMPAGSSDGEGAVDYARIRADLYSYHSFLLSRQNTLENEIQVARTIIDRAEVDLNSEKLRLRKLIDKLNRMKTSFSKVQNSLYSFQGAGKHFANTSSNIHDRNISALNRCISCVNDYLSTHL